MYGDILYITPVMVIIFIAMLDVKFSDKPSCYERAMINKKRSDKKLVKKDLKFIQDRIDYMIKAGKTYDNFVYNPTCETIGYIKDNKLFNDCRIELIEIATPFDNEVAIEIEFLKWN